jgi:hypothetical protein
MYMPRHALRTKVYRHPGQAATVAGFASPHGGPAHAEPPPAGVGPREHVPSGVENRSFNSPICRTGKVSAVNEFGQQDALNYREPV